MTAATSEHEHASHPSHPTYPWYKVLWLTGVDYFSTLGYQPAIAFLAAGALAPVATAILVLVTVFAAFPVYAQVARFSYVGQGSIAMLERLVPGWTGKIFVLVLLGFATTDFVITMTLSAADAAQHAVENPLLHGVIGDHQMTVTIVLLGLLAAVFMRGFHEAIGVAMAVAIPYILLNAVVIGVALAHCAARPELLPAWSASLHALHADWGALMLAAVLVFPKLALGLSGFETGVSVMPLIADGGAGAHAPHASHAPHDHVPRGRIKATGRLLGSAALLMSVLLITSSMATTLLIAPEKFQKGGPANGRALAYLAHELLGNGFGTLYDVVTIVILWFAGASAMAALLTLIPRYLPRFGMAPRWVERPRPLVFAFFLVNVLVTVIFRADVDAQGGAYATGVLVLMLSAAVAVTLALWRERPLGRFYFALVTLVFAYVLVQNVHERPDGVYIASAFIATMIAVSALSRWQRATELRVQTLTFANKESAELFASLRGKKVNLVPTERVTQEAKAAKAAEIRRHYKIEGPIAYLHVDLRDDTSEFETVLKARVKPPAMADGHYDIRVKGAVAIANTIAYVSEQLDPKTICLTLKRANPMGEALSYLLWGEGEIAYMVYRILLRYWDFTPEEDVRPFIYLMSD